MKRLILSLLAFLVPQLGIAQSALEFKIKPDGRTYSTTLKADKKSVKKVTFFIIAPGNISTPYELLLEGSPGIKVSLRGAFAKTAPASTSKVARAQWYGIPLRDGEGKARSSYSFSALDSVNSYSLASYATSSCNGLTEQIIQMMIEAARQNGITLTRDQICSAAGGGNGEDPDDTLSNQFMATLSKDACTRAKKGTYIMAIDFDLSSLEPELYGGDGVKVSVSLAARPWKGSKASTIKPVSEGKYSPAPILLMSTLGAYGPKETIKLYKWKNGKRPAAKTLKVVNYIYYRNMVLAEALVSPVLKDGKGSFELSNGYDAYSACFSLTRTRQNINGYKN